MQDFLSSNVRLCPFEKSPASNTGKQGLLTAITNYIKIDGHGHRFLNLKSLTRCASPDPRTGTPRPKDPKNIEIKPAL
jgi:hypothetical protein